jgi:hypothetical protein
LQKKDLDFPSWLELDVLYYYKIENQNVPFTKPKNFIQLAQAIDAFEEDPA